MSELQAETKSGASPDGLDPLREVIRRHELAAKKSLGQNFILDLNLTRRIARAGGSVEGRTVVEVGPGPGGLTRGLLLEGAARVIAVERDSRCLPALAEISARYPGQLNVHEGDALEADWRALLGGSAQKAVIAANLPYGAATSLLIGWLETEPWPPWWDRMVLMFQKEVAERIVAEPGTKDYGRLSVISQWRSEAHIALTLKPEAFTPPPKVSSAVVVFKPRPDPQPACSVKTLGKVTAAAFGQRRKMLRASLKTLVPNPEELLDAAGIAPDLRAERVPVRDFAKLALVYERSIAGR
ncbi:MAG: 16S rRNA (adenine(1518)-N(6)/adenine(1519)-N(6))-dimethyltransferase RsmA [Hyphomicrobium zavarzinii]|jgi:16S rRNA (adenine1518-N6/adenine1519-N6)-dimethyltransferase|uniref:16S rRNA (adenine(1518)-N(6)/adenine(1519)-N(6))- dimethyltransferase RsmA n=1 Tax=Hyphomicrobium TaxID=81 RepID=UPI001A4D2FDB|nr:MULTISPECIES: 16S rRNA (adenine(1518)-N(6)/adenine(1519)-N(6))-dimethyltransferase RsmA [Hyphomicrobium]MBL8847600.1 16S rRNA (adenine(1518)-N(6)/adenine(1519)-N(6))-dimethyltransferase RsmA [Hyphomicrobium zavarzinii]WBT36414.1 16S rRNA (adenine(1518)-N(6)/adenine(1519)-N(6))-dimethyltransferase RsmA [Hyphomicrobium sp. DMF-1]HML42962.1 16S rRNA (adenine(1518)-N(6)/adenine(1519)-N(6))-dimethyltransferase RsmA [Hyphomicrobium zavarzinii]